MRDKPMTYRLQLSKTGARLFRNGDDDAFPTGVDLKVAKSLLK
jgi:hypothetical protein